MEEVELEPHEQLDAIDRQTNADGTVNVELVNWEKKEHRGAAVVQFRTPAGETKYESMPWPESNDQSYKFIRIIEQTPYTLGTADAINDESGIMVEADPTGDEWTIHAPRPPQLHERLPDIKGVEFELLKFILWPLSVLAMVRNILQKNSEYVRTYQEPYDTTYLDDDQHKQGHISAVKSAVITAVWILLVLVLLFVV
jgi:hypothetical protein